MNATQLLLNGIVDYAGLFPPAALPLDEVVRNYASYRRDNRNGMLGRLILPAARLGEFEAVVADEGLSAESTPWAISALVPPLDMQGDSQALVAALADIEAFNQRQAAGSQFALVDAIEVKAGSAAHVERLSQLIPDSLQAFLEIDWRVSPEESVSAIAATGKPHLKAKIRTGGMTTDLIPDDSAIARFLLTCAKHRVGLKATAGLHHPLRGQYRLTYETDAAVGTMHGFLNVFVACCFASTGNADELLLQQILACDDGSKFVLDDDRIGFDGQNLDVTSVQAGREQFAFSFGSCSFDEPSQEIEPLLSQPAT